MYQLQNAIDNLNSPNYVKRPEDQETIYKLDKQINDLKQVINNLNQHPEVGPYHATAIADGVNLITPQKTETPQSRRARARHARSSETQEADDDANELLGKFTSLFTDTDMRNTEGTEGSENTRTGQERKASSDDISSIRQRLSDLQKQLGMSLLFRILLIIRPV